MLGALARTSHRARPLRGGSARLRLAPPRSARGLGAAPSLRERPRAFGARRVGRAGFAGHGLRGARWWLVLRAVSVSRFAPRRLRAPRV